MKMKIGTLVTSIALPLLVGGLSALLSGGGMQAFGEVQKPPLSPPGWLFPVVWTILYTLMGIASYLVKTSGADKDEIFRAQTVYGYQLVVNFFWSIFFFRFEWYLFSFFWLLLLWILIFVTIRQFYQISKPAAYLLIPYLVWVTFAGYLNLGIWYLN